MKMTDTTPKKYRITEIFQSVQYEGARCGSVNIFIRFAHCNLTCSFCDTEFESYLEFTLQEILHILGNHKSKNVILTGGEPALQIDDDLIVALHQNGYFISIETNGSLPLPKNIDWITCSPKVAEHVVKKSFPEGVSELKYVRAVGQGIPRPQIKAEHLFLSPAFYGNEPSADNFKHCIDLVAEHPEWRLAFQGHKLMNVR
jgi:organic radical activating enzyme